jgi:hypothetical protein
MGKIKNWTLLHDGSWFHELRDPTKRLHLNINTEATTRYPKASDYQYKVVVHSQKTFRILKRFKLKKSAYDYAIEYMRKNPEGK